MMGASENEKRSERAYRAVLAHKEEGTSIEEAATDLIADLLHMSGDYGGDPEAIHRMAWHHFMAEREAS